MNWLVLVAAVLLIVWLVKLAASVSLWRRRNQRVASVVPTEPGRHWLRGNMSAEMPGYWDYARGLTERFPRSLLRWYGPVLVMLACMHPETLADAMRGGVNKFEFFYRFWRPWLGNGLVTSEGKRWARDRRLLSTVFSPTMLRRYVSVYKECCTTMLTLWGEQVDGSIDVGACMPNLTFDIILKCAMGVDTDCQVNTDNDSPCMRFHEALDKVVALTIERHRHPWLYVDFFFARSALGREYTKYVGVLHDFSMDLIRKRREELEDDASDYGGKPVCQVEEEKQEQQPPLRSQNQAPGDMLDVLLTVRDDSGIGLSDSDAREHVDTFLFAGRDTTSAALQWAVYYLVEHPDVQEKCRADVQRVVESNGGLEGFSYQHISELQYLTQFVKEVLRHATIIAQVTRVFSKDTVVDGQTIPAGFPLLINMLNIHHNQEIWPDPSTFNPDRFAPGQPARHPYAFIPFAAGARNCIGKNFAQDEMKVTLVMILMRFVLLPDPGAEKPHWEALAVSRPTPNLKIKVREV